MGQRTPFAKAICGTPDLSKADDTLAATFKTVLEGHSAPAKAQLQAGQDGWVKYANLACTPDARLPKKAYDADGITCLKSLFSDRTTALGGNKVIGGLNIYNVDYYAALRSAYTQNRAELIRVKRDKTDTKSELERRDNLALVK